MTLPAAVLTTPPANSGGRPVLSWSLPDGAVQTGYKIRIYRTADLNAAGLPFYRPVGGTRDGTVRYSQRGIGADWVFDRQARSFTASDVPPSSRRLSDGAHTAIFEWRGSVPGAVLIDDQSFTTFVNFRVSDSTATDPPRVPLERVYALPRPRFVFPAEGERVRLASPSDSMYFTFDIQKVYNPEEIKLAVYNEAHLDDEGRPTHRPLYGTDDKDGDGWLSGAEWIPVGDFRRETGAAAGWQRFRLDFDATSKVNARLADGLYGARVKYRSGDGDLESLTDQVLFRLRNSNAVEQPARPVSPQPTSSQPLIRILNASRAVSENEPLTLRWLFLNTTGLKQRFYSLRRYRQTSPTNTTSLRQNPTTADATAWSSAVRPITTGEQEITLPVAGTGIDNRWGRADYGFDGGDGRKYLLFRVQGQDIGGANSLPSEDAAIFVYSPIEILNVTASVTAVPAAQRTPELISEGVLSVVVTAGASNYADVRQSGNRPEKIKVAVYRVEDIENNEPVRPPVAYTSDYKDDPIFGNRSRRFGRSETGAEWVEAETGLLSNNSGWTATPSGGLRFGNDLHYGGDPTTRTFGGIDNGDYIIRVRLRDRWGNQSPLFPIELEC